MVASEVIKDPLKPDLNWNLLLNFVLIIYLYKILNTNQSYSIKLTTHLFVSVETIVV